jgi:diguanylate cyclase (GGDEF)-like protein
MQPPRTIPAASRVLPWAAGVVAACAIWAVLQTFVWLDQDRRNQAEHAVLQAEAATVRARLESSLNATLSMSLGLSTFVLTRPDFTEADLAPIAASLIRLQPAIRNVAIAPDNEISFVYPRKGNEKALGLRYLDTPSQREAVLRLMREQRPITAGPLELAQGGVGIINRIPIVFTQSDGTSRYWGLASVMIDPRPIFEQAGLLDPRSGVRFALRGKDGLGARGAVFLGDAALFDKPDAVRMDITIPGGTWLLAASRAVPTARRGMGLQALLLLLAASVGGLVGYSLSAHQRIRNMAMHDGLTGLANRHQFNLRGHDMFAMAKRSGRPLTLLNIDVDDFKSVNDTFGHAAGDTVLVQVAHTLRDCFRETDLLARLGGDEFVVLLPDTSQGPALDALLDRLRNAVEIVLPGSAPVRLGISVGVAVCSAHTASLDSLMRQADEAMYQFKERAQQLRTAA